MKSHILDTPFGGLELVWGEPGRITRLVLPRQDRPPSLNASLPEWLRDLAADLADYFRGRTDIRFDLDWVAIERATAFRKRVYTIVHAIPAGSVMTYGAIAAAVGSPGAARAVGSSMAANPFPLIIPCHRVIAAKHRLGQFGGGISLKRRLLALEGVDVHALS